MDYETLDSDPESLCGDERQKFDALFAPYPKSDYDIFDYELKAYPNVRKG